MRVEFCELPPYYTESNQKQLLKTALKYDTSFSPSVLYSE